MYNPRIFILQGTKLIHLVQHFLNLLSLGTNYLGNLLKCIFLRDFDLKKITSPHPPLPHQ